MSSSSVAMEEHDELYTYLRSVGVRPLLIEGDAQRILAEFPDACVDCCVTSPPYWGHRAYAGGGIGLEATFGQYIDDLLVIMSQVRRVLKPAGSFWLNIGDTYHKKSLVGIPWRVAIAMTDKQSWILRNSVIWNKVKGAPDNAKDKLRNVYENVFHFVKSDRYFYDADAIRSKPGQAKVVKGAIVSATGVCGIRYRRQIELSTVLTAAEKAAASKALDDMLEEVREGSLSDFRMIIRGQQRATHSDSEQVSGALASLPSEGSISCDTTRMEQNPATYGTSYRKTRRTDGCTSRPIRKTSARFLSSQHVRKAAWSSIRSAEQARPTW